MQTNEEITTATEAIVSEATEEASAKRLRQKRYIRVIVDDDIARKRFRKPIMIDSKISRVENCYQEEVESAERKMVQADQKVAGAQEALQKFRDFQNGLKSIKGQ